MSSPEHEITVEVGSDSIALAAKGDGSERLTHAISDALSPFTQGLGYIGDVIRFYRQDTALRSIGRALELSRKLDLPLKPVAPKFLVDWVEKASLESPDEPELTNLWAGLLVSAASVPSPNHYIFKRIMSEMTREHVQFLAEYSDHDFLAGLPFKGATDFRAWTDLANNREATISVTDTEDSLYQKIISIENNRLRIRSYEIANYTKFMLDKQKIDFKVHSSIDEYRKKYIIKFFVDSGVMSEISLSAKLDCPAIQATSPRIELRALHLTEFGLLFLQSCQPGGAKIEEADPK